MKGYNLGKKSQKDWPKTDEGNWRLYGGTVSIKLELNASTKI